MLHFLCCNEDVPILSRVSIVVTEEFDSFIRVRGTYSDSLPENARNERPHILEAKLVASVWEYHGRSRFISIVAVEELQFGSHQTQSDEVGWTGL